MFLGLAIASLVWLDAAQRDLQREMGESNLWATTQAERECQQLLISLNQGGPSDAEVVQDQFEILFSRIALLSEEPQRGLLVAIGQEAAIDDAWRLIARMDAGLANGSLGGSDLYAVASGLTGITHDIALATYLAERRQGINLRERLLRATTLLRIAMIGGFTAGIVLATLLIRGSRRLQRSSDALQMHQRALEQTITERTAALQVALATETRAKEVYRSFVVTVAHQFRTSLSVIHLTAQRQLRAADGAMPGDTRRRFGRIFDAATRLERLISGFLDTAVIERQEFVAHRSLIDFNAVASVAVAQTRIANPQRLITCDFSCAPLLVEADAVLLEQVVQNLLSNAIKYSPPDTEIRVGTRLDGATILCTVEDDGCGIPLDAQAAIFERYYRAPNVHRLPGLGVGLNLVAEIIAVHGGHIDVRSADGRGSTFTIQLPRREATAHDEGQSERDNSVH